MCFVVVGRAEDPDSCGTASHGLGPGGFLHFWITVQEANVVSGWTRGQQRFSTVLLASVLGQVDAAVCRDKKHVHPMASASRSKLSFSRHHTGPLRLSFALATILTMNARRFQRTHPWRGMGDWTLNASKDIGMGVTVLTLTGGSEPVIDAGYTAVGWLSSHLRI